MELDPSAGLELLHMLWLRGYLFSEEHVLLLSLKCNDFICFLKKSQINIEKADLHNILTNQTDPYVIALTETKHRHIKSIWRQTLRTYKLVYSPSL